MTPSAEQLFAQGQVRLLDGPFRAMEEVDHAYLLRFETDRLLALFRVEAGLEPRARPYGGWESPAEPGKTWSLAGHSAGHYLSAASLMYRVTDDERLRTRVGELVAGLKECQEKHGDGSLVAFPYARELAADIRSNKVETIDKYWAPFYTIHKQLAGLRDAWLWCGDTNARQVMVRLADWCGSLVKDLPDDRRERLLQAEHGGMAEVLADVYAISGEEKFLAYARLFSHQALLDPLAKGQDVLTGKHANTQIPKFVGFQRIHELSGEPRFGAAAEFFWQTVVRERTWVNGGNSMHEHFPEPTAMGKLIDEDGGPETCNTYNMLKLTEALYRRRPSAAYVDYYENAVFNHILPSQAPLSGAGAFVYYTPLRPGFARSYGTDFNSFWCCTGTGMENHARYGQFIYSHTDSALMVNLFIASELGWPERGLKLRQQTRFPEQTGSTLVIDAAPEEALTLRVRHPAWLASERLEIRVNGNTSEVISKPGGYAEIRRAWRKGDEVQIELPMTLRVVREAQTPGWISFFYGPILLAGELGSEGTREADYIGPYTPARALHARTPSPALVAERDSDLISVWQAVPGRPGAFRSTGLVKPADVTLAPFYQVHFQRYAIYWQAYDPAGWEAREREVAAAERLARELGNRTVDRVRIGEQQPEIDHNLRFENSESGTGPEGRRWRHARDGWFSYDLKLPSSATEARLYVSYWGLDAGREFDILVDGRLIATEHLRGDKVGFFAVEYPLDASSLGGKEQITVRFQTRPGSTAGGVFDLRVLRRQ